VLQTLDQIVAEQPKRPIGRTWAAIPGFLEQEVDAGASQASATKLRSAVNGLLRARYLTQENAFVDLAWFDKTFPLGGWDPVDMPFEQGTYNDYRNRVRPLLERMSGGTQVRVEKRSIVDGWSRAKQEFSDLDAFSDPNGPKRLIPLSTLTNAARRAGVATEALDQDVLQELHDSAIRNEHSSIRRASVLLARHQGSTPTLRELFPNPVRPLLAEGPFRYAVPAAFEAEVERMAELASRRRYIRVKKIHEHVADSTRVGYVTSLHAAIDALAATGWLPETPAELAATFADHQALDDMLGHIAGRVEDDVITARHATTLVGRLPKILERNGIDIDYLRASIAEVEEFGEHSDKAGMTETAKKLSRKVIEDIGYRRRFLLAHASFRSAAQQVLDQATAERRELKPSELKQAIQLGVCAVFSAIEVGGAPVRVENVLGMPFGVEDAWLRFTGETCTVAIPAAFVKNRKAIRFAIQPCRYKFADTVIWFVNRIRPLMLKDPTSDAVRPSRWLIPMRSDVERPCLYETFLTWFTTLSRDVVGVPCRPHNYRHGQASLLYHAHPDRLGWIAQRLGDTEEVVLRSYAWVHKEKAMAEGQQMIVDLIDGVGERE